MALPPPPFPIPAPGTTPDRRVDLFAEGYLPCSNRVPMPVPGDATALVAAILQANIDGARLPGMPYIKPARAQQYLDALNNGLFRSLPLEKLIGTQVLLV